MPKFTYKKSKTRRDSYLSKANVERSQIRSKKEDGCNWRKDNMGRIKKENAKQIAKCFVIPENSIVEYPTCMEQYINNYKIHSPNLGIEFVRDESLKLEKMEILNKKKKNEIMNSNVGAISFSGGVDSSWLALNLILNKTVSKLYLFHAKDINGKVVGERDAVKELFGKLKVIDLNIELVLVELDVELLYNKNDNIDQERKKELICKNQLIVKDIVEHCCFNKLLVSCIYYNCDEDVSEYFSDNREAYEGFSGVIDELINYKINLKEITEKKENKIKILMDYNLFYSTSFCFRTNQWGHYERYRNEYLESCQGSIPYNNSSCTTCAKCTVYKEIYDNINRL